MIRTFFIIFLAFMTCWTPYAVIVVVDYTDQLPHQVHLYILLLAHLHSSLNGIIYFFTNQHFRHSYEKLFLLFTCQLERLRNVRESDVSFTDMKPSMKKTRCELTLSPDQDGDLLSKWDSQATGISIVEMCTVAKKSLASNNNRQM